MKIRRLSPNDSQTAQLLVKQFHGRDVSSAHMARLLGNSSNYLLVAETDEELIGFVSAHQLDSLEFEATALFIYEIEVMEEHQRRGVGTALIEHMRQLAQEQEMFEMYVFTNHSNDAACAFYRATGGKTEGGDELMFVYLLHRGADSTMD